MPTRCESFVSPLSWAYTKGNREKEPHIMARMTSYLFMLVTCCLAPMSQVIWAQDSGHGALEVWDKEAMENVPVIIKAWLATMGVSFLLSAIFIKHHTTARLALAGFLFGLALTKFILPYFDIVVFSGLVATIHLLAWTPAYVLLLKDGHIMAFHSWYQRWRLWILAVIKISFIFDIRDAFIFLIS